MPAVAKEIEHPAVQEVQTLPVEHVPYVEKVEKQVEITQPNNTQQTTATVDISVEKKDMGEIVAKQFSVEKKPNIVLPMSEKEVVEGLHQKIWKGVRWASEWCVMMIKKYPGRVFYLPPETR